MILASESLVFKARILINQGEWRPVKPGVTGVYNPPRPIHKSIKFELFSKKKGGGDRTGPTYLFFFEGDFCENKGL